MILARVTRASCHSCVARARVGDTVSINILFIINLCRFCMFTLSCLIVLSHNNVKLVSIIMLHLYCDLIIMVAFFHLLERSH